MTARDRQLSRAFMNVSGRRGIRSPCWLAALLYFMAAFSAVSCTDKAISFSTHDMAMELFDNMTFQLYVSSAPYNNTLKLEVTSDRVGSVIIYPDYIQIEAAEKNTSLITYDVTILGEDQGQMNVFVSQNITGIPDESDDIYNTDQAYLRLKVKKLYYLDTLDDVIGWLYFVAWSVSFYPQIWINFRRKTVRGLNLDYVSFNVLGFFCYSVYNCGLYFNSEIKAEYAQRHQYGVPQVAVQDVVFALHALFASCLTGIEAIVFDRAGQKVSKVCLGLIALGILFLFICLILSCVSVLAWLDYLYYISYVKLAITLIKYVPQAYFNFRRKSTKGWSIGNVMLDFTGGMLSMLQMFIQAYNYDDWDSLFGDPTKFALGLFSVLFDVLFMVQHYLLYRNRRPDYDEMSDNAKAPSPIQSIPRADLIRTSATDPSSPSGYVNKALDDYEERVSVKETKVDAPVPEGRTVGVY